MTIYQGNIFYCSEVSRNHQLENGYLIVDESGRITEVCTKLPPQYEEYPVVSFGSQLIIPSFCDIHLHSSQFVNTGLGYHIPFEDWLQLYTYPAEQQYRELEKAEEINRSLIKELWKYGIMNAVIMGSLDAPSLWNLMCLYSKSGMNAYIGKMNADVACFGNQAENTEESLRQTLELIEEANGLSNVTYCISPEFIPNCSDALMEQLGELAKQYRLPVQSHISESETDVKLVTDRYPGETYSEVYHKYGLFGQTPTVMAHGIYLNKEERDFMRTNQVTLAHCPIAIMNIPSGKTMPLRRFLEDGVNIGLGSDIGGGHTLNMMRNIEAAVHYSKFQHYIDDSEPLEITEAYALATVCAGRVFGNTGTFKPGYYFDALILDDEGLSPAKRGYSIQERVERFLYAGEYTFIKKRYCHGRAIEEPF